MSRRPHRILAALVSVLALVLTACTGNGESPAGGSGDGEKTLRFLTV